jgi:hypothetical protein
MKEVTKAEFYAVINKLNVHPRIVGNYSYTSIFCSPDGVEHGRIVSELVDGAHPPVDHYHLPDTNS